MEKMCCLCEKKRKPPLHSFPKNVERRQLWKKQCGFNEKDAVSTLQICSKHFRAEDYNNINAVKPGRNPRLKSSAYPSISVPFDYKTGHNNEQPPEYPSISVPFDDETGHNSEQPPEYPSISTQSMGESVQKSENHNVSPFISFQDVQQIVEIHTSENEVCETVSFIKEEPKTHETIDQQFGLKKRRVFEARYFGDLLPSDFSSPKSARRSFQLVQDTVRSLKLKNKRLQKRNRRLSIKIESLKELIKRLKSKVSFG